MTEKAETYSERLLTDGLEYSAVFVPQSQSRNASEEQPSLNWRVTIKRGALELTTDYMQGCAHIPNYSQAFSRLVVYDAAVREACETGKSRLLPNKKNGYAAAQEDRTLQTKKAIPAPAFHEVLYCLVSDASVLDSTGFEDWASDFGYDTDSRKAEQTYRQCLELALKLRQLVDFWMKRAKRSRITKL